MFPLFSASVGLSVGLKVLWLALHRIVIVGYNSWRLSSGRISEAGVVGIAEDALDPG